MNSVDRLQTVVRDRADEVFLIDAATGRSFTYAEIDELAGGVAAELELRGIGSGERLALDLPNSPELAVVYLGALYAGVVAVPLGSGFGRRELRSILERSKPAGLLTSTDREGLRAIADDLRIPLLGLGDENGLNPLVRAEERRTAFARTSGDELAAIHFTSGTTGPPRGVGHRLRDFVDNAVRYAEAVGLGPENRLYATLPMTYMAGYYNLLVLPFTLGASVVLERAFDARSILSYWEAPTRHQADVLWFVPTIMAMLLKADRDERGKEHCRDAVRLALCGTAPLDPELKVRFEDAYGIPIHDSYGLSETLLSVVSSPARPAQPGSVGTPLPGVQVEIRAGGRPVPEGAEGAVHLATPDMMAGYLQDDDGELAFSAPLVDDVWLETGDVGVAGSDGTLRITGRLKELIIRGGVNISTLNVERALEQHPDVERAAVVGIPHELLGEEIAAVVSLRGGCQLEQLEPELRRLATEQLEPSQQPGLYVQIDELPHTATGKIRKAALRDLLVDRLGLPERAKEFRIELDDGAALPRGARMIDLTHPLVEGMVSFPSSNHPRPEITRLARHETDGRETRRLVLGTHTGTHLDAPLHFVPGGTAVDAIPLDVLVGPAVVADLSDVAPREEVGVDRLRIALGGAPLHPRVLLHFDWSRRFVDLDFYEGSPFLSTDACAWLLDQGVVLLGMDTPSPDDPRHGFGSANDSPNHKLLLGRGVVLLEYLSGLGRLGRETFLVALPLPVTGGDGAPARVVAIDPPPR